jgi:hypothetical protein
MKIQIQPNSWSCLPTAFAIILDVDVRSIFDILGHDGSKIIDSTIPEPYGRKSFHYQEMVDYCLLNGYSVTEIQKQPISENKYGLTWPVEVSDERFLYYIHNYRGVLIGKGKSGQSHAVAWSEHTVFDPNGTVYNFNEFQTEEFLIITKINLTV